MLLLTAAAVIAQAQLGRISVRMRVLNLNEGAKISTKGLSVTNQLPAAYGVGLDLLINDDVDKIVKAHQANVVNDQTLTALMGERMICSFSKPGYSQRIEIVPSAIGDGYALDLNWHLRRPGSRVEPPVRVAQGRLRRRGRPRRDVEARPGPQRRAGFRLARRGVGRYSGSFRVVAI